MELVFEGSLTENCSVADLLREILKLQDHSEFGLLRISSRQVQGKVLISRASHIAGAVAHGIADSYEALKFLLSAGKANFAYLATASSSVREVEQTLYISIEKVLGCLPNLPDSSNLLFDQDTLLDRVFGIDCRSESVGPGELEFVPVLPAPVDQSRRLIYSEIDSVSVFHPQLSERASIAPPEIESVSVRQPLPLTKPAPINLESQKNLSEWPILEPLFENRSAAGAMNQESLFPSFVQTADEQRQSLERLRRMEVQDTVSYWQRLFKEQPLRWLMSAFRFSVMLAFALSIDCF